MTETVGVGAGYFDLRQPALERVFVDRGVYDKIIDYLQTRKLLAEQVAQLRIQAQNKEGDENRIAAVAAKAEVAHHSNTSLDELLETNRQIHCLQKQVDELDGVNRPKLLDCGNGWIQLLLEKNKDAFQEKDAVIQHPVVGMSLGDIGLKMSTDKNCFFLSSFSPTLSWMATLERKGVVFFKFPFRITYNYGTGIAQHIEPPSTTSVDFKYQRRSLAGLYSEIFLAQSKQAKSP